MTCRCRHVSHRVAVRKYAKSRGGIEDFFPANYSIGKCETRVTSIWINKIKGLRWFGDGPPRKMGSEIFLKYPIDSQTKNMR